MIWLAVVLIILAFVCAMLVLLGGAQCKQHDAWTAANFPTDLTPQSMREWLGLDEPEERDPNERGWK